MLFAAISILALSFRPQTEVLAQDAPQYLNVGDYVEYVDEYKGTVTEIGTGKHKGCYRIRPDYLLNQIYKGAWVCTGGQPGRLYLLDAKGKRVRDVGTSLHCSG